MLDNIHKIFNFELLKNIEKQFGTPTYVYSQSKILENFNDYQAGFARGNHKNYLICFAVKANSNLAILNLLARANSGFDIVSLGELNRVIKAGGSPQQTVFSGVGKQDFEIKAALAANIACFNVESESELKLINQIAKEQNTQAPISIRVNPNINAKSHPYISTGLKEHKFGIAIDNAQYIYNLARDLENLNIIGIDCHIGSQLTDLMPLQATCEAISNFVINLEKNNINISHINLGGGLGIDYAHESITEIPSAQEWVNTILKHISPNKKILIEPGRSIVGNAGLLLSKVIYNKTDQNNLHNFTIIDAAMNDLVRPALYGAEHKIINLNTNNSTRYITTVVGPVCESSDVFIKNINLAATAGDILAILDAGAYGFTMSSNYNSRTRAAEVLLYNNTFELIRSRETIEDLYKSEIIPK